jgi:hypothetical protein
MQIPVQSDHHLNGAVVVERHDARNDARCAKREQAGDQPQQLRDTGDVQAAVTELRKALGAARKRWK